MAFGNLLVRHIPDLPKKTRDFGEKFGILEFHSHFRWLAIKRYIDFTASRTLELGAGSGLMTFEVAKQNPQGTIIATELEQYHVDLGNKIAQQENFPNVHFVKQGAEELAVQGQFNQALLIDVIEHVRDDSYVLATLNKVLKPEGVLVISVPTPHYPEVFGRQYADSIGHLRDGYNIVEIETLLKKTGFRLIAYHYYTKFWASLFCRLFYRHHRYKPSISDQMVLMPILKHLAIFLDRFSPSRSAASLCVLAKKAS